MRRQPRLITELVTATSQTYTRLTPKTNRESRSGRPIRRVETRLVQVKLPLLPIAKQLFDPHAPLIAPHDGVARWKVGHQPPRFVFSLGPMIDQVDRSTLTGLRDVDTPNVAPLALGRIGRSPWAGSNARHSCHARLDSADARTQGSA